MSKYTGMSNHHDHKLKVIRIDHLNKFSLWKFRFETRNIENLNLTATSRG